MYPFLAYADAHTGAKQTSSAESHCIAESSLCNSAQLELSRKLRGQSLAVIVANSCDKRPTAGRRAPDFARFHLDNMS